MKRKNRYEVTNFHTDETAPAVWIRVTDRKKRSETVFILNKSSFNDKVLKPIINNERRT